MRLVVDMFAYQTNSRNRGIGRYISSLISEMINNIDSNQVYLLGSSLLPKGFHQLRSDFINKLPPGCIKPYYTLPINNVDDGSLKYDPITVSLISQAYSNLSPNIVLTPSPFEIDNRGLVPPPNINGCSYKQVAIIYDIIPYLFQENYLTSSPTIKNWYLRKINELENYDLLLSISEATRRDAINELKIAPEKIINISGASSSIFRKIEYDQDYKLRILKKFGINKPFIFYLGGNDFRKNMYGALEAFSLLPRSIIDKHQLVINDPGEMGSYVERAKLLGLNELDIVITGFTTDEELVALYNFCKVFFFPSLYEGFGLPVLEAMGCGAPVITSNNSSFPEVVGRSDAMFDVRDKNEISTKLINVLENDDFRNELSQYGLDRAKKFTWTNSSQLAWSALERVLDHPQNKKYNITRKKKKVAFVSPLPPQKSGIAKYSFDLIPCLTKYYDLDLFTEKSEETIEKNIFGDIKVYSWKKLLDLKDNYETVIYQFGNSSFHSYMIDLLGKFPGIVVLHDFYISGLINYLSLEQGGFENELENAHGLKSKLEVAKGYSDILDNWPINWRIIRNSNEIIVHSKFHIYLFKKYYKNDWIPNITHIPLLRPKVVNLLYDERMNIRKKLNIKNEEFVICSFGFLDPIKMNEEIILALAKVKQKIRKNIKLVFVGECINSDYYDKLRYLIKREDLENQIIITGWVSEELYEDYLRCADVAIQLRRKTKGETSAAVLDCLNYGIPLIINSIGTLNDFHSTDVIRISDPLDNLELSQKIELLINNENLRDKLSKNGKCYIETYHDPKRIAESYSEVIQRSIFADDRHVFSPAICELKRSNDPKGDIDALATFAAKNRASRSQFRILADISNWNSKTDNFDIQELTKTIIIDLMNINLPYFRVEPIILKGNSYIYSYRLLETFLDLPVRSLGEEEKILIKPGDNFLFFHPILYNKKVSSKINQIKEYGGKIAVIVQSLKFENSNEELFEWINNISNFCDLIICGSRVLKEKLEKLIKENQGKNNLVITCLSTDLRKSIQYHDNQLGTEIVSFF
jgi:glycosyltransferase involved in cell wall biosynthesis